MIHEYCVVQYAKGSSYGTISGKGGDDVDNDNNVVLAVLSAVGTGPNQSQYTNYFEVFHSVYSHIIKHLFNYTNKMHKVYSLFFNAVCTVHHV